ncbi:transmembrane protein, putative [Bodo saltans]|uniref:Transmembrane protein, putative n=1 Tax=Bodo saltans TaxID=75058 RepID=A0A0S4IJL5_BODSA|nr:transmembrane protein, putative [Bodo saltans]|eukprot:CUE56591.1 transmembrane protein, putative [Bodo saltans]
MSFLFMPEINNHSEVQFSEVFMSSEEKVEPSTATTAAVDIAPSAQDDESQKKKPLMEPPMFYQRIIFLSCIMFTLFVVILGPMAKVLEIQYTVTTSALDVIVLCGVHCIFALSALAWLPLPHLLYIMQLAQYETLLVVLLVTTKWWLLRPMAAHGSGADVFMTILCGFLSVAHFISALMITRTTMDGDTAVRLRWESTKVILGPYFMPEGNRNKVFVALTWCEVFVALTWCVLGLSKACSVAGPLVLGKIIFNLSNAQGFDTIDPR